MNILIDCRNFRSNINGISRYILNYLTNVNLKHIKITIALPKKIHPFFSEKIKNLELKKCQFEILHPFYKYNYQNEDLIWCPAHRIPFNLDKKIPCVVTIHDLVWKFFKKTMHTKQFISEFLFFNNAVKRADGIICVSKSTKNDLLKFFPDCASKSKVIYHGLNSHKADKIVNKNFFLMVGSIEPRKNFSNTLKAYSQLPVNIKKNYKIIIATSSSWKTNISKLIKQLKIEDGIEIIKNVSDNSLSQLYAECYCVLYPSFYEGFGFPIIEAYHHGKPVITSNCSSMSEISHSASINIDPYSIEDLKFSMINIVNNKNLHQQLSLKSKEASYNFLLKNSIDNTNFFFKEILNRKKYV